MHLLLRLLLFLALPGFVASAAIERKVEKSFDVRPGSVVKVDISGGSIESKVGPAGRVGITLDQRFRSADSEAEADEILRDFEITLEQQGEEVLLKVRNRKSSWGWNGRSFQASARLVVPADVRLNFDTSGGSISVRGEMSSDVRCDTSGGSISVEGSKGSLHLDTSGGSISVGHALGSVHADTSGGSIHVAYLGPNVQKANLDTSGGSISVGVDTTGNFDLVADTSGGRVSVTGLSFSASKVSSSHASGKINAGGPPLRADTSGGSITIKAAKL